MVSDLKEYVDELNQEIIQMAREKETEEERIIRMNKHLIQFHREFGEAKKRVIT